MTAATEIKTLTNKAASLRAEFDRLGNLPVSRTHVGTTRQMKRLFRLRQEIAALDAQVVAALASVESLGGVQ